MNSHFRLFSTATTFYRRELPKILTAFESTKGREMFKNALQEGNATSFFSLVGNFSSQQEPSYCGLSSLSMALNSLKVDPGKKWKGVWRWFSDEILDCAPIDDVKSKGMTFDQVQQVGQCNGLNVIAKRADQASFAEFLQDVEIVMQSSDKQMIVSFARKTLEQTGDGHFSCVGAFSKKDDQILVLDTARFKYPSYFVDSKVLFDAMLPLDSLTGLPRGYMIVSRKEQEEKLFSLCRITVKHAEILEMKSIFDDIAEDLKLSNGLLMDTSAQSTVIIATFLKHLPEKEKHHFYTSFNDTGLDLAGSLKEQKLLHDGFQQDLSKLLAQISRHPLYSIMSIILPACEDSCGHIIHDRTSQANHLATLHLLSLPRILFQNFPAWASKTILMWQNTLAIDGSSQILHDEVVKMRYNWTTSLNDHCHDSSCKHH